MVSRLSRSGACILEIGVAYALSEGPLLSETVVNATVGAYVFHIRDVPLTVRLFYFMPKYKHAMSTWTLHQSPHTRGGLVLRGRPS